MMEPWELAFYTDLGRYVRCPRCGKHSDLDLDRPESPDDWATYARSSSMELTKNSCLEFHQSPLFAWLWFKHQAAHPTSESPDFDHSLDGLGVLLPTGESVVPPEDDGAGSPVLA